MIIKKQEIYQSINLNLSVLSTNVFPEFNFTTSNAPRSSARHRPSKGTPRALLLTRIQRNVLSPAGRADVDVWGGRGLFGADAGEEGLWEWVVREVRDKGLKGDKG